MKNQMVKGLLYIVVALVMMGLFGGGNVSRKCDLCHEKISGTVYHDSTVDRSICYTCYGMLRSVGFYK